ncbi:Oidioi.mRNA.OKI2018_I69.XSR.g16118.t1.cds [Oikopleura dioica]|uniref:Oidioi.mRNA.OKI2018_I69.XSR.g16118.t1.cds n=1 Tax=Oikopleura dioica TaxID=34765 RepID=A0ABN7SF25_OIKDI|nr:Oidioi.mRNA.OKI2018_I69.XSR.g16118.t1.cds [Oikopleura dioica]
MIIRASQEQCTMPLWIAEIINGETWIFGVLMCKITTFLSLINFYGSTFFLVAISLDRFFAIAYPLQTLSYRSARNAVWISASIWVIVSCGSCLALFHRVLVEWRLEENSNEWTYSICQRNYKRENATPCYCVWKDEFNERYSNFRLIIGFISLFLICATYVWILCKLKIFKVSGGQSLNSSSSQARDANRRNITIQLSIMTFTFFVCWLPKNILSLLKIIYPELISYQNPIQISVAIAYMNAALSPICYLVLSKKLSSLLSTCVLNTIKCYDSSLNNIGGADGAEYKLKIDADEIEETVSSKLQCAFSSSLPQQQTKRP